MTKQEPTTTDQRRSSFLQSFRRILGISGDEHFYVLVSGAPGSGKTVVTYELLWNYLQEGKRSLYITTEDPPAQILSRMDRFGWDVRPHLAAGRLAFVDMYSWRIHPVESPTKTDYGVMVEPFGTDSARPLVWENLLKIFKEYPTRVLFDCTTTPFSDQGAEEYLRFLKSHVAKVKEIGSGVGTFVTGAIPPTLETSVRSLFDVLVDSEVEHSAGVPRRYFRVVKSIGKHSQQRFEYRITATGLEAYGSGP